MSDTIDENGWPVRTPRYIIENPVQDLLNKEIDYSVNILGNLWLERGSYGIIQGTSGIGKSVVAMQIAALTAMGRDVFGIKVDAPLKVLVRVVPGTLTMPEKRPFERVRLRLKLFGLPLMTRLLEVKVTTLVNGSKMGVSGFGARASISTGVGEPQPLARSYPRTAG